MNPTFTTAADFLTWEAAQGPSEAWTADFRNARTEVYRALPAPERYKVRRGRVEPFFVEENRKPGPATEALSPSGRYSLHRSVYGTKPGAWSYSRGEVFRVADGVKVADVKRNYASFPFLFVEDHSITGHDYLVASEDYQGHTVVDLTTGEVMSHIPEGAFQGHGWCPTGFELLADRRTLKVGGCYWACPFEFRLWDFTEPLREDGLKNLTEGLWIDLEGDANLSIEDNGDLVWSLDTLQFKETGAWKSDLHFQDDELSKAMHFGRKSGDKDQEDATYKAWSDAYAAHDARYNEEDASLWDRVLDQRRVFRLDGDTYEEIEAEGYKSPRLLAEEAAREAWAARDKARVQEAKDACAIYALAKIEWSDVEARTGRWCPSTVSRWEGEENGFYFTVRVSDPHVSGQRSARTAQLEWGVKSGEIAAVLWTYGKGDVKTRFPRTAEGFALALAAARAHLVEGA